MSIENINSAFEFNVCSDELKWKTDGLICCAFLNFFSANVNYYDKIVDMGKTSIKLLAEIETSIPSNIGMLNNNFQTQQNNEIEDGLINEKNAGVTYSKNNNIFWSPTEINIKNEEINPNSNRMHTTKANRTYNYACLKRSVKIAPNCEKLCTALQDLTIPG